MKKILIGIFIVSSFLFASTIKEINAQAIEYLKNSKMSQAKQLLEHAYENGTYDNETLFLLGKIATEENELDSAVVYFEKLLKRDQGANRVRLELAAIYYKLGNLQRAKELFLLVKASHPPKQVGDNINGFISLIDKGVLANNNRKNWAVSLGIGYMYDSNANAGPDVESVLIYDLPFTLSADAKESTDHAMKYSFSFNHLKKFESNSRLFWQSAIVANIVDYNHLNTLDSKIVNLSSGPTYKYNNYTFSLPANMSYVIIGHKYSYYSLNYGLSPQLYYQYTPNLSFSTTLSLGEKKYYNNPNRKSKTGMLSFSSRYFLNQSSFFNIGAYTGREVSKTDVFSNNSRGINLGYYKAFSKNLTIYLSENYSRTGYDGVEAAYNKSRDDRTNNISANVSYFIDILKINCSLNLSYTKNNSNITMYEYKRKIAEFLVSKSF